MTNRMTRSLTALTLMTAFTVLATPAPVRADDGETISACVSQEGRVRFITGENLEGRRRDGSPCRRHERLVTWNIVGPRGPEGEQGPEGARGPQGPAGPGFSGEQLYTVGNGDFRGPGVVQSFANPPGGSFVAGGEARMLAAVHLPQRAKITGITVRGTDTSASNIRVDFIAQDLITGAGMPALATLTSAGLPPGPFSTSQSLDAVVDNGLFHYFVHVTPVGGGWTGLTMQVIGVTISYTLE